MAKLKRIHDYTQTWSLIDVNQNSVARGSSKNITSRVMTSNPEKFKDQPSTLKQKNGFYLSSKNSMNQIPKADFAMEYSDAQNTYNNYTKGKLQTQISNQKEESRYLNQQRQLMYLKQVSYGSGGNQMASSMRP